jgi:hypothetical protein
MVKRITFLTAIMLSTSMLFAQYIEITPLFGYTFSGTVDGYSSSYDVKDDMMYGGMLDVEFDHLLFLELSYRRIDPDLVEKSHLGGNISTYSIGVEHYQVGVIKELLDNEIKPFVGATIGTSRYFGKEKGSERYWLFSAAIELGAKVFITDKIGIRLQTNLTLPMEFAGGGIFCGVGGGSSGCGTNVYFNVPLVHLDLSAGLIFRIPD